VEAPGIETPPTSVVCGAKCPISDDENATGSDGKPLSVSAAPGIAVLPAVSMVGQSGRETIVPGAADLDEAIRTAAKVAIDVRDFSRARELLDVLERRQLPALSLARGDCGRRQTD
jgi:hypothetical protein